MKAFIPAAGLGTRLKPFTLTNPKALVPVDGVPMLERVILRLKDQGFDDFVMNLHHFGDKIEDFVRARDFFGVRIRFSDERDALLDTGGGILHAAGMLGETREPFLIHNVDILSNANVGELMDVHKRMGAASTLLVSNRDSSRKLMFDESMNLRGWHNVRDNIFRPASVATEAADLRELAFSGIHIMSPDAIFEEMNRQGRDGKFSIIDFYLEASGNIPIIGHEYPDLQLLDIGKPETLARANSLLSNHHSDQ